MNKTVHTEPRARFHLLVALLLATLFAATPVLANEYWIHVKVDGRDDEQVTVNLPLSLVSAAAAMIPDDIDREARIAFDDVDLTWSDFRRFWEEVRSAPEATFVTVETRDERIEAKKEGDFLLIQTAEQRSEWGADVDVRLPLSVVDALFSGDDRRLDFDAALRALAAHGPGSLITVRDGEETVRVWIDDRNEAD